MNSPNYWYAFGCILIASICSAACGHIDEDFDLTDEEIQAKYGGEASGTSGMGISGSGYYGGCGGYGYRSRGGGHGSHAHPPRPNINLTEEALSPDEAQRVLWTNLAIARKKTDDEAEQDPAPAPSGRPLSTWGDYLAREMARTKQTRSK